MIRSQAKLFKLTSDLCLPISQPSPFKLQLSFSLSTNSTSSTTLPSLGTLNLYFLYFHAHHVALENVAELSESRRTPSHKHSPCILEPS